MPWVKHAPHRLFIDAKSSGKNKLAHATVTQRHGQGSLCRHAWRNRIFAFPNTYGANS